MSVINKESMLKYLSKGIRYDGRKFDEYRKISVETGVGKNAEGSARVKIGDTEVLVGVKMEMGTPFPDTPNKGAMMIGAELLPLSSPHFESGPPSEYAIEIARVIDRGIRESEAIDTKKLCVVEGEKVWIVIVDICSINYDGNLFDAGSLGTIAALHNTRLPVTDENHKINYKEATEEKLPIVISPIEVTVVKIGDYYIVDPTIEEEQFMDGRLTVAVTAEGKLCALQKGGNMPLSADDIDKMTDIAMKSTKVLRSHLEEK